MSLFHEKTTLSNLLLCYKTEYNNNRKEFPDVDKSGNKNSLAMMSSQSWK